MKRLTLLLTCFVLSMGLAIAQTTQVKGIVVDESNEPIPGASVMVKGNTAFGAVTNVNGQFSLDVPTSAKTLIVKYLGMVDTEVAIAPDMRIVLKVSEALLDEVIVVAYGTVKKESFTGSAGVISSEKLQKRIVTNVTKAIDGTVPGVITTSGSGQPGSGASIVIRGIGSINSTITPLYVVDGAPYDGSIAAINPADIETITVLKDASAGALYGARGGNGVVMITTKRGAGKEGKTKVNLRANWGMISRAIPRYDLMNEAEYIQTNYHIYRTKAIYSDGYAPELAGARAIQELTTGASRLFGANEQYNPYNMPIAQLIDPVTGAVNPNAQLKYSQDWLDEAMTENPLTKEYLLGLTGGSDKNKYYLSLGYLNEEGLLRATSFERISGRLSLDSQVNDWLKIGGTANVAMNKSNSRSAEGNANVTNVWYAAQKMAPIYPVYEVDANGQIIVDEFGKPIFDLGTNRASGGTPKYNCVGQLFGDKFYSNSDNFGLRAFTEIGLNDDKYGLFKGIGVKIDVNTNLQNARSTSYNDQRYGSAIDSQGSLSKGATRMLSYTLGEFLTYNRTFNGKHTIDFLGGHEYYSLQTNSLSASKSKFPFPGLYELSSGAVLDGGTSAEDTYKIESYLSRLRYSYEDKYNVDASIRTDGTSRFHKDARWGTFWSAGVNWRISQESFAEGIEWLDNLSVRASYGEQGNDAVGTYYAWQSFYSLTYPNANNNGSVVTSLESRDLKWEKNENLNVGFDARIFDKINLSVEYYNRRSSDILLDVPMSTSLGFNSYLDNIGNMYNRGVEFSLGIDVVRNDNFSWRFTALGTSQKNKITKLVTERPVIGNQIQKVGESIYSWYLPKAAGVDPTTGKQLYWVWDEKDPITDERISEPYISSDPSKAANSRETRGSRMADFYGSFSSDFTFFKNFSLSVLTTYSIGGKTIDSFYQASTHPGYIGENLHRNVMRAWKYPGDITDIPRLEVSGSYTYTDKDLIDASYFAIKNISLGYDLPKSILKKIGMDQVRFTVTADNFLIFTHLDGFNPQSSISSASTYTYTPTRTLSFGVNVNF